MMWYDDRKNLRRLLDALDHEELIDGYDLDQVLYVLEKPWKWNREYLYLRKHSSLKGFDKEEVLYDE
jgi:hypothetical protein